jgi:hypothetical protein
MTQIFDEVRQYYSSYNFKSWSLCKTQSKNDMIHQQFKLDINLQPNLKNHLQKSNIQPLKYLKDLE